MNLENLLESTAGIVPIYRNYNVGTYYSPLRVTDEPTFMVDYEKNLWQDIETGEEGDAITLCMQLNRCSRQVADIMMKCHNPLLKETFLIKSECNVRSLSLIKYLADNYISGKAAKYYCSELLIQTGGKEYTTLSFLNHKGGWDLRSETFKAKISPDSFAIYYGDDESFCCLFEDFMDMLSYVSMFETETRPSFIVLNSIKNLENGDFYLRRFPKMYCFLKNNTSGKLIFHRVVEKYSEKALIKDCSGFYSQYTDLLNFHLANKSYSINLNFMDYGRV